MIRLTCILSIIFLVAGCAATNTEPAGKWVWINPALYDQANAEAITDAQLNHAFVVAKNTCKIQALQVPIPSPSCTQPPKQDCSSMAERFGKGFCKGYNPGPTCDRTAVVAAQEAQVEIYDSCMFLSGWERDWEPFSESPIANVPNVPKSID